MSTWCCSALLVLASDDLAHLGQVSNLGVIIKQVLPDCTAYLKNLRAISGNCHTCIPIL